MSMGLGIGLHLGSSGGGASFNPATLSPYLWYAPNDAATIFQTTDTSTPGVDGQPCGRVNDKSGNGYNAVQATAGFRSVWSSAGYLTFDGVDDGLSPAVAETFSTSCDVFVGIKPNADTQYIIGLGGGGGFFGCAQSGNGGLTTSGAGTPTTRVNGTVVTDTRDALYTAIGAVPALFELNGADLATTFGNISIANYGGFELSGRIYSYFICPALSAGNRALARTYFGAQMGLTL